MEQVTTEGHRKTRKLLCISNSGNLTVLTVEFNKKKETHLSRVKIIKILKTAFQREGYVAKE